MITYDGIEWDYDNLSGIGYSSETLLEPYAKWFYLITEALNQEFELLNLNLTDRDDYTPVKIQKEATIKLTDHSYRIISRLTEEDISLSDESLRDFGKKTEESFSISDESLRDFNKYTKDDVVYLLDETKYIYDEGGVEYVVEQTELSGSVALFDVELNDSPWNESNFDSWCENDCPVNYNEIRPFIPGEYEYKDAYVGFKLTIPSAEGRFGVANSTVYVDVEDTVEKGNATASTTGLTRVEFSKKFYTSPHIMASLNYATESCYVDIPTVSQEYFEFRLKSTSTGNLVAGEISWLADGY